MYCWEHPIVFVIDFTQNSLHSSDVMNSFLIPEAPIHACLSHLNFLDSFVKLSSIALHSDIALHSAFKQQLLDKVFYCSAQFSEAAQQTHLFDLFRHFHLPQHNYHTPLSHTYTCVQSFRNIIFLQTFEKKNVTTFPSFPDLFWEKNKSWEDRKLKKSSIMTTN